MISKLMLFIAVLLYIGMGCTNAEENLYKIDISKHDMLLEQLPKALNDHNIWYELKNRILTYQKNQTPAVNRLMTEIMAQVLPLGRSISLEGEAKQQCFIDYLNKENITYSTKKLNGELWVILDSGKVGDYLGVCP